ncbi:MAG: hypothetical protein JHD16_06965, partial [Solirubrobacteraceae bacterium]|nr:hypothetical protein [Solirubrobacteraceae bacterium]
MSRVGGPESKPFPAQLVTASSDGRYVVLRLGTVDRPPPATEPEAEITSPSGLVVRDRVAQTITPIPALDGAVRQITDDGTRLLTVKFTETGQRTSTRLVDIAT